MISNVNWDDLYTNNYKVEMEDAGTSPACPSYFHRVRRMVFGKILRRRTKKSKFSKCNECHRLCCMWETAGDKQRPKQVRKRCKKLVRQHNCWQLGERKVYYHRRTKGRMEPDRMSVIDDGMGNDCQNFVNWKFIRRSKL